MQLLFFAATVIGGLAIAIPIAWRFTAMPQGRRHRKGAGK
jgi:hypothetical protein